MTSPLADGIAAPEFLPVVSGTVRWNLQAMCLLHTLPDWPAGAIRAFIMRPWIGVWSLSPGRRALCRETGVQIPSVAPSFTHHLMGA